MAHGYCTGDQQPSSPHHQPRSASFICQHMAQEGRESKCHIGSYRTSFITILIKAEPSLSPLSGADRPHLPSWGSTHRTLIQYMHTGSSSPTMGCNQVMNLHLSCNQALFGQPWTVSYICLFKLSGMTSRQLWVRSTTPLQHAQKELRNGIL